MWRNFRFTSCNDLYGAVFLARILTHFEYVNMIPSTHTYSLIFNYNIGLPKLVVQWSSLIEKRVSKE